MFQEELAAQQQIMDLVGLAVLFLTREVLLVELALLGLLSSLNTFNKKGKQASEDLNNQLGYSPVPRIPFTTVCKWWQ